MHSVLFLVHRIPYPPNKGDKIRSYHLLRYLSGRYRVFLGAFVDDPFDFQYKPVVDGLCQESLLIPIHSTRRKIASLGGLLTGEALSLPYYRNRQMQAWVDATIERESIDTVVVFSSTMAQFVEGDRHAALNRIADFVDVDSDKWAQYAARASGPRAWIYRREAAALQKYERAVARSFDATLLVTQSEADLFRRIAPESARRISHFDNGVDTEYFDPALAMDSPYAPGGPVIVFTGAMDYWPNVEAVQWFVADVLPTVRASRADVRFVIVGSNPTEAVVSLGRQAGVEVTGRVPDVRPYLRYADVAVAPLRIARGIQNKVLEALAMARPVVCSGPAAEGLRDSADIAAATADDAPDFARKVLAALGGAERPSYREFVLRHYSWESQLEKVGHLIDRGAVSVRCVDAADVLSAE